MSDPVYEWFKDFFLPGFVGIGTTLFGLGAVLAARKANGAADESNGLAAAVRADELNREAASARERYREQLGHFIESAITSLVEYGNSVEKRAARSLPERQLHASTQARLMLVHAMSQGDDKRATKAAYEVFHQLAHQSRWHVRQNVAGLLAGALANTLAEQDSIDDIEAAIRDFIRREEDDV